MAKAIRDPDLADGRDGTAFAGSEYDA